MTQMQLPAAFRSDNRPPVDPKRPRIYLDMDGVVANFDAAFYDRFNVAPGAIPDAALWDCINSVPTFFRDLPVSPGALEFFETIRCHGVTMLTACPKSTYASVAHQKREWVREHLGHDVMVLPVMGGRSKPYFMHAPGDVLIDDHSKNTERWTAAGGFAILHRSFEVTAIDLNAYIHEWIQK